MSKNNPEISLIIPAYNTGDSIYENLRKLHSILTKSGKSFEIICVVDGATDDTYINAKNAEGKFDKICILRYRKNRGKGYAVRFGMAKAKGLVVGFIDAGKDLHYEDVLKFFKIMKTENADIVVGSKRHPQSHVNYSQFRKIFSSGYQLYVKNLFELEINDTQAGMKIFRSSLITKILPVACVDGFAFDIEMLSIADKLYGAKIVEAPIHVNIASGTSTITIKGGFIINSLRVFWDTLKIYYKLNISDYYKRKTKNK